MNKIKQLVLVIIGVLSSFIVSSQIITNYTQTDGLLSNYVECVAVDINDNIWFGTAFGVSMYDGSSWTAYDQASYPLMLSNDIKAITATSTGDIWIGTDYGVNQLIDGTTVFPSWESYTTTDGLANNKVTSIDEAPNGDLWFSHSSFSAGVSVFDGTNWNSYNSPDLPISGVCGTSFDSNGDKWFASPLDGLVYFDGNDFTNYTVNDGLLSNYSTAICIDNNDNKWLGSSSGMSVVNSSANQFTTHTIMYSLPPPDTLNPVVDIAKDSWGRIWTTIYVGYLAEGGVAFWNGNQWLDYDHTDGLAGPNVNGLAIDSQNNVWVATTTGVSRISAVPSNVLENKLERINISPNPSSSVLNISLSNSEIGSIRLFDNTGRMIVNYSNILGSSFNLDVSNILPGAYYLKVLSSAGLNSQKIIIY